MRRVKFCANLWEKEPNVPNYKQKSTKYYHITVINRPVLPQNSTNEWSQDKLNITEVFQSVNVIQIVTALFEFQPHFPTNVTSHLYREGKVGGFLYLCHKLFVPPSNSS